MLERGSTLTIPAVPTTAASTIVVIKRTYQDLFVLYAINARQKRPLCAERKRCKTVLYTDWLPHVLPCQRDEANEPQIG